MKQCLENIAGNSNSWGIKTAAVAMNSGEIVAIGFNWMKDLGQKYRPTPCHSMEANHAEEMLLTRLRDNQIKPDSVEVHLSHYPCIICIAQMRGYGLNKIYVHGEMAYSGAVEYTRHLDDFEIISDIKFEWQSV